MYVLTFGVGEEHRIESDILGQSIKEILKTVYVKIILKNDILEEDFNESDILCGKLSRSNFYKYLPENVKGQILLLDSDVIPMASFDELEYSRRYCRGFYAPR